MEIRCFDCGCVTVDGVETITCDEPDCCCRIPKPDAQPTVKRPQQHSTQS